MKLIAELEAWACPMCNGKGSLPDLEIDGSKHRCRSCAPIVAALPAILTALRAADALDLTTARPLTYISPVRAALWETLHEALENLK